MTASPEEQLASVPHAARQAGNVRDRWVWTAPTAWTDRMLTALETGVKGNVWFSLIDKVYYETHLFYAADQVLANKGSAGVDHVTTEKFAERRSSNVEQLSQQLRDGTYRPQSVRRTQIPKPGSQETRSLGIPTVRDRVVQNAIRHVMEPIFEREFAEHSYGFRPQRGCKDALRRVDDLLKQGFVYVVDVDLKSYFDTIPHGPLMHRIRERIADRRLLSLIESFLKAGIMEGLRTWTPEKGAPQGAVLSPLLSNIYLNPLDHHMAQQDFAMVRYADDFVVLCRSLEEAERALNVVRQWTAPAGLTLHPVKTRIVDARTEGFDFLGYTFQGRQRRPRKKSLDKLKAAIRAKTKRTNGQGLTTIIASLNPTLVGWYGYFRHSYPYSFQNLDGWIRMRLRSILRKRVRLQGRGRGRDHYRWPNRYFTEHGLYCLTTAHRSDRQSSHR